MNYTAATAKVLEFESERPHHEQSCRRPVVKGRSLYVEENKLFIKGVTYGPFREHEPGEVYGSREMVASDFAAMAENGINAVRTYTVPPVWLLDLAGKAGLRVMVGLAWEQHVTFLDQAELAQNIKLRLRDQVHRCAHHPAILCYTVGNEIPGSIVRWHGHKKIERFVFELYCIVKQQDPTALVTYVNYPTTEYLSLPFLDLVSFNVYLEDQNCLEKYIQRLLNLAGDRPLWLAEVGLDSRRNGPDVQAKTLNWQIKTTFELGCSGIFVFSWTDDWHRGGHDIEDWDFGLTCRDRTPKLALESVRLAYKNIPFSAEQYWPKISVIVCTYNGEATIRDTLQALENLEYPDYEVIVVNDGSVDRTAEIAAEYDVILISTDNFGLSNARNTGLSKARGTIVAYIDDDAYPDPHWLNYIALSLLNNDFVGVGGPNISPAGDSWIAQCVAQAPGAPTHVLLTDEVAEHIPGCNMAFYKSALMKIGGFDSTFRTAGDDVDICWRLQDAGGTIGYSAAAIVFHHRRSTIAAYWKQQLGYGKAESLLENKWPGKYNDMGHPTWKGRIYGNGIMKHLGSWRTRIYHGVWGSAPFQFMYQPEHRLSVFPSMPEWYLLIAGLILTSLLSPVWPALWMTVPLLGVALGISFIQAVVSVSHTELWHQNKTSNGQYGKSIVLTIFLHLLQPLARLLGRMSHGLTPWRKRTNTRVNIPLTFVKSIWLDEAKDPNAILADIWSSLRESGVVASPAGEYDRWDLTVRGGLLGLTRLYMAVEEHGSGQQLLKFRIRPIFSRIAAAIIVALGAITLFAALDNATMVSFLMGFFAIAMSAGTLAQCMQSQKLVIEVLESL